MKNKKHSRQSGFTLIEMLLVVLLLSIVVGAVFSQIDRAQVRYRVEDQKVDLTQQEREFIDQFTRDLHQAGYPSAAMYGGSATANQVALGVTSLSSNDIVFEGDVDGDGAVDTVEYSYFDGSGWTSSAPNPCPCIRRSQLAKGRRGTGNNIYPGTKCDRHFVFHRIRCRRELHNVAGIGRQLIENQDRTAYAHHTGRSAGQ